MFSPLRKKATSQQEDVQVEVSLGAGADLYSIMVRNQSTDTVQSVVAVPKEELSRRGSRQLQKSRYSQSSGTPQIIDRETNLHRKADLMRNLSPINNERSSPFGADHHSRRNAQSMPPPINRSLGSEQTSPRERREHSCAPALNRGGTERRTSSYNANPSPSSNTPTKVNHPPPIIRGSTKAKKPDLVSATAARGFLRVMRPSVRKVHNISSK